MARVCEYAKCGQPFDGKPQQRFCSKRCANLARPRRGRVLQPATCPACDMEFLPNRSNRMRVATQVYCSNQCSASPRQMRQGVARRTGSAFRWSFGEARYVPSRPPERTCAQCGESYRPKRLEDKNKFCSRKCKDDARADPIVPRPCVFCGEVFTPLRNRYAAICSKACRQRARRAAFTGPRRAVKTGIAERDGWCCQLCGGEVEKWRRFPDPLMASIDHIVLTALGGSNDQDNLRLTHLGCNQRRGGWTR